jgi:hypothetical protein
MVITGVEYLWKGERDGRPVVQKAHAGIERNTSSVVEGYDERLLRHEAAELAMWQRLAADGGNRIKKWQDLGDGDRRELRNGLRRWQKDNPEKALALARRFHAAAETGPTKARLESRRRVSFSCLLYLRSCLGVAARVSGPLQPRKQRFHARCDAVGWSRMCGLASYNGLTVTDALGFAGLL